MKYGSNNSFISNCDRNRKKQVENIQAEIGQEDRKEFDKMFSYSRLFNSAGSNATRSQLIDPILMSIVLEHYRQLDSIQKQLKIES